MSKWLRGLVCVFIGLFFTTNLYAQLTANFNSNIASGCSPIVVQFTDLSTGGPTSWNWNLGNGTFSTLQNPSTTYITPGTYTVTLTVTNASGTNTKTVTAYITVIATPSVNFNASDSGYFCPPKTIQFNDLSSLGVAGPSTYVWDFGDGYSSNLTNPVHTYTSAGNFSVSLQITNASGCTKLLTKPNYIHIVIKPTANFTANNVSSCTLPLTVNFNNITTGGVTYVWDFGDGGTSTLVNPSHVYSTAGTFTVRLIATNSGGCSDTMTQVNYVNTVSIYPGFTVNNATVCTNVPISFTNTSLPGPGTSTWYFGDGTTFTGVNAIHAYTTAGTYNVKLIVNYGSCVDSAFQTVTVNPRPVVNFTATPNVACSVPFTTTFSNTTTGAVSYLWDFGDGTTSTATNPTHTYNVLGYYTVTLIATAINGCTDTLVKPQYIDVSYPSLIISPAVYNGCVPQTLNFTTTTSSQIPISSYTWNFGDGTIITTTSGSMPHTYTSVGTYIVSISFTTGTSCVFQSSTATITVGNHPTAGFTAAPTVVCPDSSVVFTNTSTGATGTTYLWEFGDGNTSNAVSPVYSYGAAGFYTVTLIATNNGCTDSLVIPNMITVNLPKALFTASASCVNRKTVTFTDQSLGADSWLWDFGDGTTSTLQNPTHTYANYNSSISVTLVVHNNGTGCNSTKVVSFALYPLDSNFTVNNSIICKNQTVTFTAQQTQYIGSCTWNFGDGSPVQVTTTNSVTHTYTTNGVYSVKLVIKDERNCMDSLIKPAYIHVTGPSTNFSALPTFGCVPLLVNFSDSSTSPAAITSKLWLFGDGGTSTSMASSVTHTYQQGVYTVRLILTDINGCMDSLVKPNYIAASKPTASFFTNDTGACAGQPVNFTNNSVGPGLTYLWNFGDGSTSTALNPAHAYAAMGTYTIKLIVTDSSSCKDSMTRTAYIHINGINLGFTASDTLVICPPATINFTNTSTNATYYSWDFGNGNTSAFTNPSTTYTQPGIYTVKLIGYNSSGCTDSITHTVHILGPTGTLTYSPLSGCAPLTVSFSSVNTNTQSLLWDMDNGVTISNTSSTLTYTYSQPGFYIPKLILSNGASCLILLVGADTIKVDHIDADFSFTAPNLCQSATVSFNDTVYSSGSPIISRSWTFGDGGTSTIHNPTHFYASPGTYTIKLILGSTFGCYDTIIKTVVVQAIPNVTASPNQILCLNQSNPIQLQAYGAPSYSWTPSASLSCNNCSNPLASPTVTTTYIITGTTSNGCTDTAQVKVTVAPLPTISAGANQTICMGSAATLVGAGGLTYTWSPAAGLSCTGCVSPSASPISTTTYSVIGIDTNGCHNSSQVTVNVNSLPAVSAGTNPSICIGGSTQLQATGGITYSWLPSTGLSCTTCSNPIANPTTTTTYTVFGVDANGCTNSSQVTVTVHPLPTISAGANQNICIGNSILLQATGGVNYTWTPSTSLSCNNCSNPLASPTATATYSILGTDANGCQNTGQITVNVNPQPVVSAGNNKTICLGTPVQLTATGAQTYNWSPSTGLSCTNCPNPMSGPSVATTYTVIGTDANGCLDTAQVDVAVNPLPPVNAGPDVFICKLGAVQLQATGANSYTWSPTTGLSCINCSNPLANPTVATTYVVTGTDTNGCVNTDNVKVSIFPQPLISAGADQTICNGKGAQLQASGGQNYTWSPITGLSCIACPNPIASPNTNIIYTVIGTDANGCQDSDKVAITVIQMQPFTIGKGDTLCQGESTQLFVDGGDTYTWSPPTGLDNPNIKNPTAAPTVTTTYQIIIKQGICFIDTANITVVINPKPTVNAGPDQHILSGSAVNLYATATNTTQYLWSPSADLSCDNCNSPVATPKQTTTYTVFVSNQYGCKAQDDVTLFVSCDQSLIFMSNTFTPNGDGNNDRYYPQGKGISNIKRFRIYNRWGQLMFDEQNFPANNELYGWDGTFKGEQLKPDVFVYIVDAVCENGEPFQLKGDVSLIR